MHLDHIRRVLATVLDDDFAVVLAVVAGAVALCRVEGLGEPREELLAPAVDVVGCKLDYIVDFLL